MEGFIDIIMPAYNMEQSIEKALNSLCEQSYKNFRLIVINDASTDNTINILKLFKSKLDIIIINNTEKTGSGLARNIGLKQVTNEFFMFIDADDFLSEPDYLEKMIKNQKENDSDIVYSGYTKLFTNKTNYITPNKNINAEKSVQAFLDFEFGTHASWAKLYKTDLLPDLNFSPYGFSIDVILGLKAFSKAKKISFCDSFGYVYSRLNQSIWNTNSFNSEHFYSSFRLLVEVYAFSESYYDKLSLSKFERLWCRDHYPRIIKFLRTKSIYTDIPFIISILREIVPLKFKIIPLIKNLVARNILDTLSFKNSKFELSKTHQKYIDYLNSIVLSYESNFSESDLFQEKSILIYVSHLSKGGLERMALSYADILSEIGYKIYIIIDKNQNDSYHCNHETILFKGLNKDMLTKIYNCKFFIDFKYKKSTNEFPLIKFVIDRFSEKYIATVHNTDTCEDYIDKIITYGTGKPFQDFKYIICVSNKVKQSVLNRYPNCDSSKLVVLDNFVDINTNIEPVKTNNDFILFVGRLDATYHKGLDILIDAYSASDTPFKLLLIGANELTKEISLKIKQSKRAKDIIVKGFTSDIYKYMSAAKFVVVSSRYEGNQLSLLESLYCGTPVVSTKVGASEEIIKDGKNGYLVDVENIKDLTEKINLMSQNYEILKPNCTESVKAFSKDNFKQNLQKLLETNNVIDSEKSYDSLMLISRFVNLVSFINLKETTPTIQKIVSYKKKSPLVKRVLKNIYKLFK